MPAKKKKKEEEEEEEKKKKKEKKKESVMYTCLSTGHVKQTIETKRMILYQAYFEVMGTEPHQ